FRRPAHSARTSDCYTDPQPPPDPGTFPPPRSAMTTRRQFLQASAVSAAATLTAAAAQPSHVAGGDQLRIGLIGCGGRGTGAAENAVRADKNVQLVALGDAFPDRIEKCVGDLRKGLGERLFAGKVDVPAERR